MHLSDNLRQYGTIDVSGLLGCLERQSEAAWHANHHRQNAFHIHKATETIYLIFDEDFRHIEVSRLPKFAEFADALKPVFERIAGYFDWEGWAVRCILTRLAGGGIIAGHTDFGYSLLHAHRFHIPLITNEGVLFTVGGETVHMSAGDVWEINNGRRHSVTNLGAESRVHLIVDWAEPMTHEDIRKYEEDRIAYRRRVESGLSTGYD